MTGQVKEEILTRWGELGLRVQGGRMRFDPALLDATEIPADGALTVTLARVPYAIRTGPATRVRVRTAAGWVECIDLTFEPQGVLQVEAEVLL